MKALKFTLLLAFVLVFTPFASAIQNESQLSGYWNLDDGYTSGTTVIDYSGNYNLTNVGTATTGGTGVYNQSYDFDGSSDYLTGSFVDLDTLGQFTYSIWLNPDVNTTAYDIMNPTDAGWGAKRLYVPATGEIYATIGKGTSPNTACGSGYILNATGDWTHVALSVKNSGEIRLYVNGVSYKNCSFAASMSGANPDMFIGAQYTGNLKFNGQIDDVRIYNKQLTSEEIIAIYEDDLSSTPPITYPYAVVQVKDLYDNATLSGLTVHIGSSSNTTNSSGHAIVWNNTGLNYTVDGGTNYFNASGTATQNASVTDYVYGAFVTINVTNIINESVSNYTAIPDQSGYTNYSSAGVARLYLKPNALNNVSIVAYDGNWTLNSTQQTYSNKTFSFNTTGKDISNYQLDGLFQALLTVNVSVGYSNVYVINHSTNVTGIDVTLGYSKNTTNYNITYEVMVGNYSIEGLPEGYSISRVNASIGYYNFTPRITLPAFALNSLYLTFKDEITESAITQNISLELISDLSAGVYTTTNGSLNLELLTPTNYTLRYKSTIGTNYTERDYYQVLAAQNYYTITLYSLENNEGTDMVVTITDTGGDPVEDATVKLLRYYTSCNCYNIVEMAKTSASGESYFIVDAYDAHYKFSVEYQGLTYFLSSSPENFVPNNGLVSRSITINLGSAYFESFRALGDFASTLTYNNITKGLSFTWNDPSGLVTQGCLYAEYLDGVDYTQVTPNCQAGSTGSVILVLNDSLATYKYYAEVETSTTYSSYVLFSGFIDKLRDDILNGQLGLGALLGAGLVMVLALMFSYSAIAVMIVTAVGVIGMSVLGIATLTTVFITGFATLIIGIAAYLMRS